jgi:ABC-2 type transport system permease protein
MTGLLVLVRFVWRRERLRIPLYVLIFVALIAQTAVQSEGLYSTRAERDEYAATIAGNPGLIAMVGPPYAVTNVGGDVAWQWGGLGVVIVALMSMFIVGRHTRAEEQSARSELVRAAPVGRLATLTAALLVTTGAQLVVGAAVALAMIGVDQPAAGSLAFGASLTAAGLVFAAVAAVAAQVTAGTGGMYGIVGAALGGSYALRAAGDVGDGTLSWLSPIGWAQAMRPYAGERWWPLLLSLAATALLMATAIALLGRRDEGAGLVAPRPGPATASRALATPLGLALRLQRGALIGWTTGLFLGGLSIGLTGNDAESLVGDSDQITELAGGAGGSIVDQYFAVSLLFMGLIGAGFAIQSALRLRGEETEGHAEPLLATALARPRWAAGHLAVAIGGTVLALGAAGLGTGLADAINSNDAGQLPRLLWASLVAVPAVWVLIGVAALLFGVVPRAAAAAWGALGACFLLAFLGPLLSLPQWLLDVSPFEHVPLLPAEDFSAGPLLWLSAVAAVLVAAALAAFRRRDVPAT